MGTLVLINYVYMTNTLAIVCLLGSGFKRLWCESSIPCVNTGSSQLVYLGGVGVHIRTICRRSSTCSIFLCRTGGTRTSDCGRRLLLAPTGHSYRSFHNIPILGVLFGRTHWRLCNFESWLACSFLGYGIHDLRRICGYCNPNA